MKILILGISGFIGGHIFRHLTKLGHDNIFGLSRHKLNHGSLLINNIDNKSKKLSKNILPNNIKSLEEYFKKNKFDIVINAISYGVNYADKNGEIAKSINNDLVLDYYFLSSHSGIKKYIHFGSSDEYGKMTGLINEETVFKPISIYGQSKHQGVENLLNEYSKNNLNNILILRLFSIYGPLESESKLIPYLLNAIKNNSQASMTEGLQLRNYLFIEDLLEIINYFINNINIHHELIYNVASKQSMTIRDIATRISKVIGSKINLSWGRIPYREGESFEYIVSTDKLRRHIKYEYEKNSFENGVLKIINEKNDTK